MPFDEQLDIAHSDIENNIIKHNHSTLYNIAKNNDLPLKLIVDIFSAYIKNSQNIQTSQSLFWEENEKIHMVAKKRKRNCNFTPPDCDRCKARIWNNGYGGQCTRNKHGDHHCLSHQKKLKYGNIDDELPSNFKHSNKGTETFYNGYKQIMNDYIPIETNLIKYKGKYYYWDPKTNSVYATEYGNKYIGTLRKNGNTFYINTETQSNFQETDNQDSDIEYSQL